MGITEQVIGTAGCACCQGEDGDPDGCDHCDPPRKHFILTFSGTTDRDCTNCSDVDAAEWHFDFDPGNCTGDPAGNDFPLFDCGTGLTYLGAMTFQVGALALDAAFGLSDSGGGFTGYNLLYTKPYATDPHECLTTIPFDTSALTHCNWGTLQIAAG